MIVRILDKSEKDFLNIIDNIHDEIKYIKHQQREILKKLENIKSGDTDRTDRFDKNEGGEHSPADHTRSRYTEADYIHFVNSVTKKDQTAKTYLNAIKKLEEKIGEKIFDTYSLKQMKSLKEHLLKGGDLHDFNVKTSNRAPSAAVGKLIIFVEKLQQNSTE